MRGASQFLGAPYAKPLTETMNEDGADKGVDYRDINGKAMAKFKVLVFVDLSTIREVFGIARHRQFPRKPP